MHGETMGCYPQFDRAYGSINNERDGSITTQRLGVGAGLVSLFHDALCLLFLDSWQLGMELDSKAIAAFFVFNEADERTDR